MTWSCRHFYIKNNWKSLILGNIHKLGRLLTHEWWTVVDKEGKSKERYLFLFKARILICKVRRISDDRSVFILKEIVRLPEVEVKDLEENKLEVKSADESIVLTAHKEETKKFWLKEIKQYITDVVALQEHALDDLKIDPKQHLETNEPTIKLPTRIEAYEPNQNVKPSDFAEDYTISVYSTTKATEELRAKAIVSSIKETSTVVKEESVTTFKSESSQETVESKAQKAAAKESSKIPVLKKPAEEKPKVDTEVHKPQPIKKSAEVKVETAKPVELKVEQKQPKVEEKLEIKEQPKPVQEKPKEQPQPVEVKPKEQPKVEEKPKEQPKVVEKPREQLKVEEKPKELPKVQEKPKEIKVEEKSSLPEFKSEIVRKSTVELQSVTPQPIEKKPVVEQPPAVEKPPVKEAAKPIKQEVKPEDPVKSELSEVEASVSEKLDRLSQKLRAIRNTETDKEASKLATQEASKVETEKREEELRKQEAIRESIQEKIEDDYIAENSVIKRIEERYKRNYKDKDIKTLSQRKQPVEEAPKASPPKEVKVEAETKPKKPSLAPLKLAKEAAPVDKEPEITQVADNNKSDPPQQPQDQPDQQPSNEPSGNQSGSGQDSSGNSGQGSSNNQGGDKRQPDKERSPPSPGAIRLPGFFDPPPPTQYETSIEVHVKKEKYPDPPPKITRKVVVKNEELERKTEEFLRGEIPYEKEDFSLGAAQKKIKNLKHNLGKTGDTIKFAEDTVSKARVGDFKHIKTPGTVVGERKKDPVFEYQYTVEDPKTGLCITTSEAIDFEDAEEELQKLAIMDAEKSKTISKRVEGEKANELWTSRELATRTWNFNFNGKFSCFLDHLQIIWLRWIFLV